MIIALKKKMFIGWVIQLEENLQSLCFTEPCSIYPMAKSLPSGEEFWTSKGVFISEIGTPISRPCLKYLRLIIPCPNILQLASRSWSVPSPGQAAKDQIYPLLILSFNPEAGLVWIC